MNPPQRRGTPDFLLLIMTLVLVAFGLLMVFSASSVSASYYLKDPWFYTKRQAIAIVLGMIIMFIGMNVHYSSLKKWVNPFFIMVLIMLVLVPIFGKEVKGATSWFSLGPFNLQPAEFAKLSLILYLSALISKKEEKFRQFKKGLLPSLIIIVLHAGLIMMQPDLGSCMILVLCTVLVIVVGGANLKHLFLLATGSFFLMATVISVFLLTHKEYTSYRMDRFTAFLNPWSDPLNSGFHIIQSLYAFGHGGLTGAGFGQSIQKMHYLPAPHNDFIFSIIGEELGFIGSTAFLIFYILFVWRGIIISLRSTDIFATLAGVGIVGMIGIQALINLGGVTDSIPLTGVTLPLISYGGSSILVTLGGIGILLSISREQNKPIPGKEKRT